MQKVSFVWINAMALCALLGCLCTPAQAQEGGSPTDGACCFQDGSCSVESQQDCFLLGGEYSGDGSNCADIDCFGACCLFVGGCAQATQIECEDVIGGTFIGNGISCEQVICVIRGACCLPDGPDAPCRDDETWGQCDIDGGIYEGYLEECIDQDCRGACCFMDGTCEEDMFIYDCQAAGGEYQGDGSSCPPAGSLCNFVVQRDDWNFVQQPGSSFSLEFEKFDPKDGLRHLEQVTLISENKVIVVLILQSNNPAPMDTLIKSLTEFTDIDLSDDLPLTFPNPINVLTEEELNLICSTNPLPAGGFCAYDSPYIFEETTTEILTKGMDDLSEFVGAGETFTADIFGEGIVDAELGGKASLIQNPNRNQGTLTVIYEFSFRGACCFCDGSCEILTEEECIAQDGEYQGDGVSCDDVDCIPWGSCCLCTGECEVGLTQDECDDFAQDNGITDPDDYTWTICGDCEDCPVVGACCLCTGECFQSTQEECEANPDFVSFTPCADCDEVDCQAIGSCCLCTGECIPNITEAECLANPNFYEWTLCGDCNNCVARGSCCLCTGDCQEDLTPDECDQFAQDNGITDPDDYTWMICGDCEDCERIGACCLCTGECFQTTEDECVAHPDFLEFTECADCSEVDCVAIGSCCLCTGECIPDITEEECLANPNFYQWTVCGDCDDCEPRGSCCLCTGDCVEDLTQAECDQFAQNNGVPNPDDYTWTVCGSCDDCAPLGACCFCPPYECQMLTEEDCIAQGGTFNGCVTCGEVECPCCGRIGDYVWRDDNLNGCQDPDEDGIGGVLVELFDTCNPGPGDVPIQTDVTNGAGLYEFTGLCAGDYLVRFHPPAHLEETIPNADCGPNSDEFDSDCIDGEVCVTLPQNDSVDLTIDCGLVGPPDDDFEPGWNWVDNLITLTGDQPVYWSAATGLPAGLSPWAILDPDEGSGPGRPDPEGSGQRVLRGFVVAFAVDQNGDEIRWNHLAGNATVVDYLNGALWEYNAWPFPVVDPGIQHGQQTGTPGVLNMDGNEYAYAYDQLLLNFQAVNSAAYSSPRMVTSDTDLTLHPLTADLRQETDGPVFTKAEFTIWNENEVKFSGAERCIACWDQFILSQFDAPNHFLMNNLQTDHGKARINGIGSQVVCGPDAVDAALLGVSVKELTFDMGADFDRAGTMLHGLGTQSAVLQFDSMGGTPESQQGKTARQYFEELLQQHQAAQHDHTSLSDSDLPGDILPISGGLGDRVSGTEKGSLLFYSAVEVRWDQNGEIVQDTFLQLTNDLNAPVMVQMYFVNGDDPVGSP